MGQATDCPFLLFALLFLRHTALWQCLRTFFAVPFFFLTGNDCISLAFAV